MISVVITCVHLNKMNVHVKNLKTKRQPIRRFRLTELIETMGIMCGMHSSKTYKPDERTCNDLAVFWPTIKLAEI